MLRLRAVALLLLSPGVGGAAVHVAHSCPLPVAATAMAGMEHHHHQAPTAPGSEHGAECQCIGACSDVNALALPTAAVTLEAATVAASTEVATASANAPPLEHPRDRHPPSTAPPLV